IEARAATELRQGHRQRVAVLFVDVRGFSQRAEGLSPEAVSAFLSTYRAALRAAADAHRGVIDKFVGDGAMIVFGIPEPGKRDAADALACARSILARVATWSAALEERGETPVSVGVGLHIGEAFVGAIGDDTRLEFTVVGDVVNIASRMEEATKTVGAPLVATAEFLAAAGERTRAWRALQDFKVRGKTAATEAFASDGI
ncbi:MAG: adenylate/guanylate cyclase domain-containing protein, partial [Pseudomonadota bacterium]